MDVCTDTVRPVNKKLLEFTIQMTLKLVNEETYILIGVVEYVAPNYKRSLNENDIGHYRALSRMPNNAWYKLDDTGKKVSRANLRTYDLVH